MITVKTVIEFKNETDKPLLQFQDLTQGNFFILYGDFLIITNGKKNSFESIPKEKICFKISDNMFASLAGNIFEISNINADIIKLTAEKYKKSR